MDTQVDGTTLTYHLRVVSCGRRAGAGQFPGAGLRWSGANLSARYGMGRWTEIMICSREYGKGTYLVPVGRLQFSRQQTGKPRIF